MFTVSRVRPSVRPGAAINALTIAQTVTGGIAADETVNGPPLSRTLLVSMSLPSAIEVTVPPRRFASGYVDGVRPSHHMNNTKTKFANPWPSFRLVAVDVYSSLPNLCRSQTFFQLLSVRDFARDTYCLIKHLYLGGSI